MKRVEITHPELGTSMVPERAVPAYEAVGWKGPKAPAKRTKPKPSGKAKTEASTGATTQES